MSGTQHEGPETLHTASIQSRHIKITMGQGGRVTSELDIDLPILVIGIQDPLYRVQVYLLLFGLALPARSTQDSSLLQAIVLAMAFAMRFQKYERDHRACAPVAIAVFGSALLGSFGGLNGGLCPALLHHGKVIQGCHLLQHN